VVQGLARERDVGEDGSRCVSAVLDCNSIGTEMRAVLGECKVGDQVNLERAMGAHVRFGGHFVQVSSSCRCYSDRSLTRFSKAHVDITATLVERKPDGDSVRLLFQLPELTPARPSLLPYLIEKGYIAIDGASLTLTVVNDADRTFGVMLIKHTQEKITLGKKPVGSKVNIEVDMVGKFVEKSVSAALSGGGDNRVKGLVERIVEEVLAKKGIH
jgi:riboflavin synthase